MAIFRHIHVFYLVLLRLFYVYYEFGFICKRNKCKCCLLGRTLYRRYAWKPILLSWYFDIGTVGIFLLCCGQLADFSNSISLLLLSTLPCFLILWNLPCQKYQNNRETMDETLNSFLWRINLSYLLTLCTRRDTKNIKINSFVH